MDTKTVRTALSGSPDTTSQRSASSTVRSEVLRHSIIAKDPGFVFRDWLIIIAEVFVSLSWMCIRQRRRLPDELKKKGLKEREEIIDFLFWEGWVVVGGLIVGYFVDSHISIYKMAIFNVLFHFSMVSFIFMEEIIMLYDKANPYSQVMSTLATVSICVIKSTDFTRLIVGLQNLKTKNESKIFLFLFLFMWVGGRIYDGGILWTLTLGFKLSSLTVSSLALVVNGISAYLYVFLLQPKSPKPRSIPGSKILGCMVSSVFRKLRYKNSKNIQGILSFANRRYDRRTVLATKEMVRLFKNLFPTLGYAVYITSISEGFIHHILMKLKETGLFYYLGMSLGLRLSVVITMLITQFAIIPLCTMITDATKRFHIRFLIGYIAAILSMFYTGLALTTWNTDSRYSFAVGDVRIFNARNNDVNFSSLESDFSKLNFTVKKSEAISLRFPSSEKRLFRVGINFEKEMAWITHISVDPWVSTGYILTENPPFVMRIEEIPIEEGPPGTNDPDHSRLFLFNSVNQRSRFIIKKAKTDQEAYRVESDIGFMHVFQLPKGEYDLVLINMARLVVNISIGGVYGVLLYSDGLRRRIIFDETMPANSLPSSLCIGFVVPAGVSLTFAYVSLWGITFTSAPEGLLGIAFGFLTSVEYLAAWILYIGYKTWHPYAKAVHLFSYGFGQTFFLFLTMFVFMKYKDSYGW